MSFGKRLFRVVRELNVSADRILSFLEKSGYSDDVTGESLNSTIKSEEAYLALRKEFADDAELAERVRASRLSPKQAQEESSSVLSLLLAPETDTLSPITNILHTLSMNADGFEDELNLQEVISEAFETEDIPEDQVETLAKILNRFIREREGEALQERLSILYEYQEKYLELVKEYKEEIKFVNNMQEDLRRERAQFFSQTLKEVSDTLSQAQIGEEVAQEWIQELVSSYTSSLDVSNDLTESRVADTVGKLQQQTERETDAVDIDSE
jgi:hypothetical protein